MFLMVISPLELPVASIESLVLNATPPEARKGSTNTLSSYLLTISMTHVCPPNLPCMLPSDVTKAIFELSALLKMAVKILVVLMVLGAKVLMKVSYLEMT